MSAALRLALLTPILPDNTGNGLAMRMGGFAQALSRMGQLDVILAPVAGPASVGNDFLQRLGARVHIIEAASRPGTLFAMLSRLSDPSARLAAFKAFGLPSLSAGLSAPALADMRDCLKDLRPDAVLIGRSYLAPCISVLPEGAKAWLDLDEDDFAFYQEQARVARASGDEDKAEWLEQEGLACDRLIAKWHGRFSGVFASSQIETDRLAARHDLTKLAVIENAIEIPSTPQRRDDQANLLFVGSLSYAPNADGLIWFCERVLPLLRACSGGRPIDIDIAGAGASKELQSKIPQGVRLHGFVPSLTALYQNAAVAIAPLQAGGGTRIKLLEAGAHGLASVATSIACEGLSYPVGWTADTPSDFADACMEALFDPRERRLRADAAHASVRRMHDRDVVSAKIIAAIHAGLASSHQP